MRKTIPVFVSIIILAVLGLRYWKTEKEGISGSSLPSVTSGQVLPSLVLERQASGLVPSAISANRGLQAGKLLPFLKTIHSFRTHPLQDQAEETYAQLFKDPRNIQECQSILLELNETRQLYGSDQALARISAIGALGYLAAQGNLEPLEKVIETQTRNLSSESKSQKGELADLTDGLTEWIKAKGREKVQGDLSVITQRFSPSESNPKLRQAFLDSLWNVYGWKTNDPEMVQQIERIFGEDKNESS